MDPSDATEQPPVKEGDILAGKYRVEKVLGVGGMGVVVAAMHTELEQRVALKFLLPSAARNPGVVARFNREARAAVKIKSQHVARVSDVGTLETGTPYIVMEYLEGKDLGDVLAAEGKLPLGTVIDYVMQAAEAVAEAHAAGIVHRDLKPPNLFLAMQADGTPIVKVLDFGISKAALSDDGSPNKNALTGTSDVFGSPTYMSPEQLKASRDVDGRTDVWSLGVILYELMSGHAPFDRPTVAETFGAILYEQAVPLRKVRPDVPEELERAVMKCLEKDVANRMPNVGELARALSPFAAGAGSRASADRSSRILRRAGVTVDSSRPGPMSGVPGVSIPPLTPLGSVSASPGSQTRSAWGTASRITRPNASRTPLIAGIAVGMLVVGSASVLLVRRLLPSAPPVTVQADHGTSAPATPTVATAAQPAVSVAPAGPDASSTANPAVAASNVPIVTPAPATATAAPHGKGPHGPGKKLGPSPSGAAAPDPPPATPPPVAKPQKPPDDDFGDRK